MHYVAVLSMTFFMKKKHESVSSLLKGLFKKKNTFFCLSLHKSAPTLYIYFSLKSNTWMLDSIIFATHINAAKLQHQHTLSSLSCTRHLASCVEL